MFFAAPLLLGIGVGVAVGLASGNAAVGTAVGVGAGLLFAAVFRRPRGGGEP